MMEKDLRERKAVHAEKVRVLLENLPTVLILNLWGAPFFLLLMWKHIEHRLLFGWLLLLLLNVAVRAVLVRRCRRTGLTAENAAAWSRRFLWGSLASGLIWGAAGVTMDLFAPPDTRGFALFVLGGLAAAAIASHSAVMSVYLAFVLPLLLPFTLLLFIHNGTEDLIKGGLTVFFFIVAPTAAWRHNRALHRAIVLHIGYQKISEELALHRDHLQELVEERTRDLHTAKEAAEAANRSKSEFLANISHEIRTPLHAVLSFAAIGQEQSAEATRERMREYFTFIRDSGRRLLELLNDVLDFSRLEARRMQMERREQDLKQVVETAVIEFGGLLGEKSLSLELDAGEAETTIWCDAQRMLQVVRNLIANAIEHSPPGGCIRILFMPGEITTGRRRSDRGAVSALDLSVEDQGAGIPPDELEAVFGKFVQSSRTRSGSGGSGLGLAICREIVEMHGGIVQARNSAQGGATFTISIPYGHR